MENTNASVFSAIIEQSVTTQAEAHAWESDCLWSMKKAATKILKSYPSAHAEIEDVINEALRATLRLIKQGRKIEKPKEYLVVSATRHAINRAKKLNKKEPSIFIDDNKGFDIASTILSHSKQLEIKRMYLYYLSTLTDKESVIAEMLPMMSPLEIAETLGVTRNSINVSIHRIRQKLSPLREYLTW